MIRSKHIWLTAIVLTLLPLTAAPLTVAAQITPPAGYIYDTQLLGSTTVSCVASGPGGTFVAIGPGFTANAQVVVLAKESGATQLVAFGFNSIGDCAYDAANDVLYVTDNAGSGELPTALTGDTVFAVPSASSAPGLAALGLELVPANSVPAIASVAVDSAGDVFVSNATGPGVGTVSKIDVSSPALSPFASAFDFTAGLALDPASGDLFAADSLFPNARIRHFTSAGVEQPVFAGPSPAFGSYDLAFDGTGRLLATGLFGGDIVAFDSGGTPSPFVSGLNFATSITADPFTARVQVLSGFTGTDEDRSLHRFTPISQLVEGEGSDETECLHELYGVSLTDGDAVCVDGAACDADGQVNDRCVFPLGFCFNVDDGDLPDCDNSAQVTESSISSKPFSTGIVDAAARVTAALPVSASSCIFSDGIVIPVSVTGSGEKKEGKGKIKVKTTASDGRKDNDVHKLVCQPAP